MAYLVDPVNPPGHCDTGDWNDNILRKDVATKFGRYLVRDLRDEREGKTLSVDEAISYLKKFGPTRCWLCGIGLTWPQEFGPAETTKVQRCKRQYSFDRIDNKQAHHAQNLRVTCWACNTLNAPREAASHGPCERGCHSGHEKPALTQEQINAVTDILQNPGEEFTLSEKFTSALAGDLWPDEYICKQFRLNANDMSRYLALKFAFMTTSAIEWAFGLRYKCIDNIVLHAGVLIIKIIRIPENLNYETAIMEQEEDLSEFLNGADEEIRSSTEDDISEFL